MTQAVYSGALGHTYGFRSRGHDRAGNAEDWPVGPDARTLVVARVRKTYFLGAVPVAVRAVGEGGEVGPAVYLHLDHLGSPVVATDGAGGVVGEVRYLPYGGIRVQVGEMPTALGFTGQRLDAGVGLLYYRARTYDPGLGRFIQPDTVVPDENKDVALTPLLVGAFEPGSIAQVGEENREIARYGFAFQRDAWALLRTRVHSGPSNPQLLNRYTYALNSPQSYVDPMGHSAFYSYRLTPQQLYILYNWVCEVNEDWIVKFYLYTADAVPGLILGVLEIPDLLLGLGNDLFGFLPGEKVRRGFDSLGRALGRAEAAYATWVENGKEPEIYIVIREEAGAYTVDILICVGTSCQTFSSGPISSLVIQGIGRFHFGLLDALAALDVHWGSPGEGTLSPPQEWPGPPP